MMAIGCLGDMNNEDYDVEKFLGFTCMTKDKLLIEDDQD